MLAIAITVAIAIYNCGDGVGYNGSHTFKMAITMAMTITVAIGKAIVITVAIGITVAVTITVATSKEVSIYLIRIYALSIPKNISRYVSRSKYVQSCLLYSND